MSPLLLVTQENVLPLQSMRQIRALYKTEKEQLSTVQRVELLASKNPMQATGGNGRRRGGLSIQDGGNTLYPTATFSVPPNDDCMHPTKAYCIHSIQINNILRRLHKDLRNGVPYVQQEIDRYLFVCGPRLSSVIPVDDFILQPEHTLRFEMLPNIQNKITSVLSIYDPDTHIPSQFLRQCIPLKRRTKRAQRDIIWSPDESKDMKVFVRCIYGTLLGLYPLCSKFTHFHNRIAINGLLHAVLVADPEILTQFCNTFSYTLRLATMEHCCYIIDTFAPSLASALNKKKQFPSFTSTIYSVGDSFRAELNKNDFNAADLAECWRMMLVLEETAQTLFDRCSRAFRTVISPSINVAMTSTYHRNILALCKRKPDVIAKIMTAHACSNKYIFRLVNENVIPVENAQDIWYVLNNMRVYELTGQIAMKQLARSYTLYPEDISLRQRLGILQVCIICALRKNYCYNSCATRFDAVTRRLTCVDCQHGSIIQINLIGRVLYIGTHGIVFSTCCMVPVIWSGKGTEWNDNTGTCECQNNTFQANCSKRKKTALPLPQKGNQCYVCGSRMVVYKKSVLNLAQKRNQNVHFCNKHTPPQAFLRQANDITEICEFFEDGGVS